VNGDVPIPSADRRGTRGEQQCTQPCSQLKPCCRCGGHMPERENMSHGVGRRAIVSCFKRVSERLYGHLSTREYSENTKKHALAPLGSRTRARQTRTSSPPPEPSQEKLQRSLPHAHMALSRAGSRSPIAHIAGLYTHAAQERLNSKNWLLVHRERQQAISGLVLPGTKSHVSFHCQIRVQVGCFGVGYYQVC